MLTDDQLERIEARAGAAAQRDARVLVAEIKRLRAIINSLANRVAAQSELLSKKAEKQ